MQQRRRVVITGLGVLAPNGCGKDAFWQACLQGRSGVQAITRFDASPLPTRIAGEIAHFSPTDAGLTATECAILDRGTQFAVAAANLALQDAGNRSDFDLSEEEREHTGVYLGTAMASVEEGERLWLQLTENGTHPPQALLQQNDATTLALSYIPSAAVAAHHRLRGPCLTIATGCSSGADAIGLAFWKIQEGYAERMLAGGSDSAISLLGLNVFCVLRALSTRNEEPEQASRPYDASRDGFVLSEGAAILLLEEREVALKRGAHIYAEICSYASNSNAYHMTALPENGMPLQNLLQQVMEETHLQPEQIGYINSHGSSTRLNEIAETAAYKGIFGPQAYHIPISSTKSLIGHTQGAASAIELLVTALALDQQMLPPTINLDVPDPLCDLDYIANTARTVDHDHPLTYALTHSSGFGGANTALILARHEADSSVYKVQAEDRASEWTLTTTTQYSPRRVVVTGMGVIAPVGIGKEAFWDSIQAAHSYIGPLTRNQHTQLPLPFVGEVRNFHVENYVDRKLANRTDRMTHFALASIEEALQDAKLILTQEDPQRIGAVIANTLGGVEYVTQQIEQLHTRGTRFMSAYTAIAWLHMANVGQASIQHNFQGYGKVPVNDMCGGLDALGLAYEAIKRGTADVLIAGGSEAPLSPCALYVLASGAPLGMDTTSYAYRPFDMRGTGPLLAEGAGICVLEEYEHARRRNAPIYGEISGYAQTCAPLDLATPTAPDAATYARALHLIFDEANLTAEDIACVYLDGRALPTWDASETAALQDVFGSLFNTLPCSVPRTQFGHSLAASGALDTITALLSLRENVVPPTVNCEEPDTYYCPPGLVRGKAYVQTEQKRAALICTRGLGGSHVMLAVRKI